MRVAMIGPFGFHPKKTMRARAFPLARALATQGHDVALYMPPWHTPAEAGRQWEEDGVRIHYTALDGGTLGTTRSLVQAALSFAPDLVHAFKPKAYSGLAAWWLWHRRRTLPLIMDSDDWEGWGGWNDHAPYSWLQKRFFAWQEAWGLRHNHALTVASRALQSLAWAARVPPRQVHYLPNGPGIPPGVPGTSRRAALGLAQRPVLLLYSRLFEFNIDRLMAVLVRVQEALPDLALLAVGAGLYEADAQTLRERLAATGLADAVVDVGWIEEMALPAVLSAADAGLYLMDDNLLNRTKCPVKLADMLAVGVPVVAEGVGQVFAYVRHGETGFVHPSGDTAAIADSLVLLLRDGSLRRHLSAQAALHIERRFSWERRAAQLDQLYTTLAAA